MNDLNDLATVDPVRHWWPDAADSARAPALIDDLVSASPPSRRRCRARPDAGGWPAPSWPRS